MDRIKRLSITLHPSLLTKLDLLIKEVGYPNRSKAIQDALNAYISNHEKILDLEGFKTGLVTVLYDHSSSGLEEMLTEIQHKHRQTVIATMHVHLTKHHCLEAIAIKGDIKEMIELLNSIRSQKGVVKADLLTV